MCLYGDLVFQATIVKRWDSALVPVPSAAPKARRLGHSRWPLRSSFRTVFIGSHLGIIAGISAEDGSTMSALNDPYPAVEHPLCNLCSRRVGGGESDGARATG